LIAENKLIMTMMVMKKLLLQS